MRRKKNMAEEEVALVVAGVDNCTGDLVQLPDVEGTTYHLYKCKVCGQLVHVGLEHLELYGLPPEHARLEEDK
jgi:hypothetical protein